MRVTKVSFTCLLAILALSGFSHGKEWRSIKPLQSTREDVVRLMGHSADSCECLYDLGDEIVSIVYSSGPCEKGLAGGWNVPRNTVVSIIVTQRVPSFLADLKINESKYKKIADPHVLGNFYYTNEEEGVTISTYNGRVKYIEYTPTAKDAYLRCPGYAPIVSTEDSPATYPLGQLDVYGNIPFEKERTRLDILASEIQEKPDTRGYIIVYAGRRARPCEAQARAEQAKNYLINKYGINAARIVAVDGGYREEFTVEIWFGSSGSPAPIAFPTVRPSEVQIIKDTNVRTNNKRSPQPTCERQQLPQ